MMTGADVKPDHFWGNEETMRRTQNIESVKFYSSLVSCLTRESDPGSSINHFNKTVLQGKFNSKGQNPSDTIPALSRWLFLKLVTWQHQYCFPPAEPASLGTCRTVVDDPERVAAADFPYLAGCWAPPPWPSCPRRSGSGRRGGTARRCRPPPPGCGTDLWAGPGSARGKPCGWWCPTRRGPPPWGPWPGSTCGQGWCWRGKTNKRDFQVRQGYIKPVNSNLCLWL